MTSQTLNAVVHNLIKAQGSRTAEIGLRGTVLDLTDTLRRLIASVHDAYANRTGKSYGSFNPNEDLCPSKVHVRSVLEAEGRDPNQFLGATRALMEILADKAAGEPFATGGYVLMAEVSNGINRWLLISILTDVAGAAINENLEVVDATHLDLAAMRFAGRINLTEWANGDERYISFLRGKKQNVAQYFQDFIGVSTVIRPVVETQNLVKAVKKFAVDQALEEGVRERLLAEVKTVGMECIRDGHEIDLDALANRVWPDDPEILKLALAQADPPVSDGFLPDGRSLGSLTKFKAKTARWSLEFDRAAMADHTIQFDTDTRKLTISNIPDDVADRLADEFQTDTEAP